MSEWEEAKIKVLTCKQQERDKATQGLIQAADAEITRLQENQLPDWLMHKNRKVDVRNLKECIKQQESEITRLKEELDGARELIAWACAGTTLYADDGELQDNSQKPFIDFRRDTVEEIKHKIQIRGNTAYAKYLNDNK